MNGKRIALLICFTWLVSLAYSQDTSINFNKIRFVEVFKDAKESSKPVLLYFHIDGCGSCIQMERGSFTMEEVYNYINSNFISYNINARKGEGVEINKTYKVKIFPTILLLNEKGTILDRLE